MNLFIPRVSETGIFSPRSARRHASFPRKSLNFIFKKPIRRQRPVLRLQKRKHITMCPRSEIFFPYCVRNYLSTPNDGNRFSSVDDDTRKILSPTLLEIIRGNVPCSCRRIWYFSSDQTPPCPPKKRRPGGASFFEGILFEPTRFSSKPIFGNARFSKFLNPHSPPPADPLFPAKTDPPGRSEPTAAPSKAAAR